jgi:hypothetical protein
MPLVVLALASLSLLAPEWVVDYIAPPVMLGAVAFLYVSGLLIRPMDRRDFRRWRTRHLREKAAKSMINLPPPV